MWQHAYVIYDDNMANEGCSPSVESIYDWLMYLERRYLAKL